MRVSTWKRLWGTSLERDGFVTRPARAPVGKALPTSLTPAGRRNLARATSAVRAIERQMLAGLSDQDQVTTRRILSCIVESLAQPTGESGFISRGFR